MHKPVRYMLGLQRALFTTWIDQTKHAFS